MRSTSLSGLLASISLATLAGCGASGTTAHTDPQSGPPAGYADGHAAIPAEAQAEDVSKPTAARARTVTGGAPSLP